MAVSKEHGGYFLIQLALKSGLMLPGSRWLFLGNQRVRGLGKITSVAPIFEIFGAEVTMLDVNGKDGARAFDLRTPLPEDLIGWADVTTNFGTSEHVIERAIGRPLSGQAQCFKNVHDATKPGGLMLHAIPASGGCLGHGTSKYTVPWFRDLAAANQYEVMHLDLAPVPHKPKGEDFLVVTAMRRPKRRLTFNEAAWQPPPLN